MNISTENPQATASDREALHDLAQRVLQLTIDRRNPEKFFVDKSEIAHDLRRLARKSEGCR